MTDAIITPLPQMSAITDLVISELINVEGYFQNSEKPNANGKNLPGTIWRFIYDIAGHRNHLTVMNPESLCDDTNSNPEVNHYYRVSGFAIQPKEDYTYLFFLTGTKSN
jgi:hypothetical protein